MVEFSSVAMPISAPGAEQTLQMLAMLDARGQRAAAAVATTTRTTAALEGATRKAHLSTGKLSQELLTMTRNLLGVNPAVAQVSGMLGKMAIGDTAMIGILAGLAAIGFAYEKITEKARAAAEENAKFRKELGDLANAGELGKLREQARQMLYGTAYDEKGNLRGVSTRVQGAFKGSIADLQAELAELEKQIPEGAAMAPASIAERYNEIVRKLNEVIPKFRALQEAANNVMSQPAVNAGMLPGVASTAKSAAGIQADTNAAAKTLAASAAARAKALNSVLDMTRKIGDEAHERTLKRDKERNEEIEREQKRHAEEMASIAQDMAARVTSVIAATLDAGLSGGIGNAFEAMGKALLKSMGEMFIQIGEKGLAGAILTKLLRDGFSLANPNMSIQAALGLISLGTALVTAGSMGGAPQGAVGYGGAIGASMTAGSIVVGPAAAPNTTGVRAASPVQVNATFIGKYDARAGRELLEMIDYHQRRRS